MTDQQLQLALAKMLPEKKIRHIPSAELYEFSFIWSPEGFERGLQVTEWLHVCWLVEETLTEYDMNLYFSLFEHNCWKMTHSSWQQRAEALCKVIPNQPNENIRR